MALFRSSAPVLRALLPVRTITLSPRNTVRRLTQNSGQSESYASTGTKKDGKSGDLPWMIGSAVVTITGAFYLLRSSPARKGSNPHHDNANAHSSEPTPDESVASPPADATSESVSQATKDTVDQVQEKPGQLGEKAGELYSEAKDTAESNVQEISDEATSGEEKTSQTVEQLTDEIHQNPQGGDGQESKMDTGNPDPLAQVPDALSDPNKRQTGKTPHIEPPAASMTDPHNSNEMSGK